MFSKDTKSPPRQPVITCNAAPAVKKPNHLHCSTLLHFSCNGEQPSIPTTLHKYFIAKDQTEWSPGPLGSLPALCSQPLLDDQWCHGSSSQFTLNGTQVDILLDPSGQWLNHEPYYVKTAMTILVNCHHSSSKVSQ